MPTEAAARALEILRDGSQFQWYVIPLFAFVVYIYAVEIERKNWNLFLAGLAFWGMDWFNEIWNSLVFHFTHNAPVWGAPGQTAYLILIGLNIEISFMFAIAGIGFSKMLPKNKRLKMNQLVKTLEPNEIAYMEIKAAQTTYVLSMILGFTGGFLIGWPVGAALGGGEPNWAMAAVGAGLIVVTIPISNKFNKQAKSAVDNYNSGLVTSSFWDKNELNFTVSDNGVGLTLRF